MSNWSAINAGRQTVPSRTVPPNYCTTAEDGFNGIFRFTIDGCLVRCIASDGEGWQHVSVSLEYQPHTCPSWKMMCKVKDIFWDEDEVVCQFHPRKKDYVNHHKGCLHLWRCIGKEFPTPPPEFVGPQ
jgi:hypothetical protein